ncbi:hypothetical protein N0V90_005490 [Kalmusia sp. IMI 367209]|nr:hypothetical protein N0V90_005490 [Kalmusia sp. IMI 367209]
MSLTNRPPRDKQRIVELVKAVSELRAQNAKFSQKLKENDEILSQDLPSSISFELGGVVKDALIEHLQDNVDRLNQAAFDQDHEIQCIVAERNEDVIHLLRRLGKARSEGAAKNAKIAELTAQKEQAEKALMIHKSLMEASVANSELPGTQDQTELLDQAITYAQDNGDPVVLYYLTSVVNLANAKEKELLHLRAVNVQLQREKRDAQALAKSSLMFDRKTTVENRRPIIHSRAISLDTKQKVDRSLKRKPLHRLCNSFSGPVLEADETEGLHGQLEAARESELQQGLEIEVLKECVEQLREKLSKNVEVSEGLMDVAEAGASRPSSQPSSPSSIYSQLDYLQSSLPANSQDGAAGEYRAKALKALEGMTRVDSVRGSEMRVGNAMAKVEGVKAMAYLFG